MFKHMKVLLDPSETETSGSLTTVAKEGVALAESQPADTQQTETKTDETKLSEEEVRSKLAHDIFKKSESSTDAADKKEESDVQKEDTTEEAEEEESGKKEDEESDSGSDKGPVPYKRFDEVNSAKLKLEEKTKEWEPLVAAQQQLNNILSSAGVGLDEFQNVVEMLVLSKSDPTAAMAKLKPLYTELNQYSDDAIPPEVQAKISSLAERVKEGEMSQEAADELKAAWLEGVKASKQVSLNAKKGQMTEKQRQEAHMRSFVDAASSWGKAKQKTDPDYQPVKDGAAPGLFELTEAFFTRGMATAKLSSPHDVVKLLEDSFAAAKQITQPKKNGATKPQPTSRGTTTVSQAKPKTFGEVAARVAAKHGITYVPGQE